MNMNLLEFNMLPMQYQAQFTWDYGNYIASRKTKSHVINLYHTKNFFIEVHFSLKSEGVDKISSFTNLDHVDGYLARISLKELKL
jgi:hypothetical protein